MAKPGIVIDDLKGGVSDEHPLKLGPNQVVAAWDGDWSEADVFGRRNGCTALTTGLASRKLGLFRFERFKDPISDYMLALDAAGAWTRYANMFTGAAPTTVTPSPADQFQPEHGVDSVSLHGKLFLACYSITAGNSANDRLHVYDGTDLRRAGFTTTIGTPTLGETAAAGTYATQRYFRVRFVKQNAAGQTVLRSEPGSAATITPSGTKTGVVVTRPTAPGEAETHWEVEESLDNANFYRIATVALATTTYDDTTVSTAVASNTLSEDIGDYTPFWNPRWLTVDNDRLIALGSPRTGIEFSPNNLGEPNVDLGSRVGWSQLLSQSGVGNDERIPADGVNYIDLDPGNGGSLTGGKAWEGKIVAFKLKQIHFLVRAGTRGQAYILGSSIHSRGALPYSVIEGIDRDGRSAIYFMDPENGPSMVGAEGVLTLAPQLVKTWRSLVLRSVGFENFCRGIYYHHKREVWWYVTTSGSYPNVKWVLDCETGGISFHTVPDSGASAMCLWRRAGEYIDVPTIATASKVLTCDDALATNDAGTNYRAYIKTRAYSIAGPLHTGGVESGMVEADPESGVTITASIIRDYGKETISKTALLTPEGSEQLVLKHIDDFAIREAQIVQFEIGDASAVSVAAWRIHKFACEILGGGKAS